MYCWRGILNWELCDTEKLFHFYYFTKEGFLMNHTITQEQRYEMLTSQPVEKVIPRLAVPTIISMLISSIYNTADTFFVSQLGTSASGAV